MSYDQQCENLAWHFLTSNDMDGTPKQVESLAQYIQNAVENWFSTTFPDYPELTSMLSGTTLHKHSIQVPSTCETCNSADGRKTLRLCAECIRNCNLEARIFEANLIQNSLHMLHFNGVHLAAPSRCDNAQCNHLRQHTQRLIERRSNNFSTMAKTVLDNVLKGH